MYILCENTSAMTMTVPGFLKTQEMCNETMQIGQNFLAYVPEPLKTQ